MSNKNKGKMSKKNKQQQNVETMVRQFRQIPNIMTCLFEHKTRETTADFEWKGPKLNDIWPEVLAFFRWTNETYRSESQVRLFLNSRTNEWKAWAFPQRANGGMSAKELTQSDLGYEKTIEQRAQFPDPDWYYWGTVHHHCNASAFQSSTDQENERDQDGIHITVGSLGSPHYDIHFRLYISRFKLDINLCDFWEVGDELARLPRHVARLLKDDAFNELAKLQMGVPPALTQEFPAIWKDNIIDCTPKQVSMPVTTQGTIVAARSYDPMHMPYNERPLTLRGKASFEMDLRKAAGAMMRMMEHPQCTIMSINDLVNTLKNIEVFMDDEMIDLMDIMSKNDCVPGHLIKFIEDMVRRGTGKPEPTKTSESRGPATTQEVLGLGNGQQPHTPPTGETGYEFYGH